MDIYHLKNNKFELSLKGDDIEHLYKFNSFMQYKGDNVKTGITSCNGKKFSRCRWSVANKHLWNTLNNYGCTPRKSLTLCFPNLNIFRSKLLIRHFMRGYFDGDGCIFTKRNSIGCSVVGNKEFLQEYGKHSPITLHYHQYDNRAPSLNCSCSPALKFASFLYDNSSVYLTRKYEKYKTCRLTE